MIKDLDVRIIKTSYTESYFYVTFEAKIEYENNTRETYRDEISVEPNKINEEIVKERIMKEIYKHAQKHELRELGDKLKRKHWKNEDFSFPAVFGDRQKC